MRRIKGVVVIVKIGKVFITFNFIFNSFIPNKISNKEIGLPTEKYIDIIN